MPRSGPGPWISRSFNVAVPASGRSNPTIRLINVLLPVPENPTIATNSPFSIVRLTSRRTHEGPKFLVTFFSSKKAMAFMPHAKGAKDAKKNLGCWQQDESRPNDQNVLEFLELHLRLRVYE